MRRLVGVLAVAGALAIALVTSARAAVLPTSSYDLRPKLILAFFGETSDARASILAAHGDRTSESPLRELALLPRTPASGNAYLTEAIASSGFAQIDADRSQTQYLDLAQTVSRRVMQTSVLFAPPPAMPIVTPGADAVPETAAQPSITIAAYQPVPPTPTVRLQPGALSFGPLAGSDLPSLRVGPVQVQSHLENVSTQAPEIALHDNAYDAGATFDVRAGQRNVNVDLRSSYEQLSRNDAGTTPSAQGLATSHLPGDDVPLVIPNYANMSRVSVGAGVAVPVVNNLTLNLNYDAARLLGGYGLPGLTNLDAVDNVYGGRLTFAIPHSSSTLSFAAYQNRFQDNILPASTLSQTSANVNFTVKF